MSSSPQFPGSPIREAAELLGLEVSELHAIMMLRAAGHINLPLASCDLVKYPGRQVQAPLPSASAQSNWDGAPSPPPDSPDNPPKLPFRTANAVEPANAAAAGPQLAGPSRKWDLLPLTPRGRKRRAKTGDDHAVAAKPVRHGPLDAEARKSASLRRRTGVCVICHYKKTTCTPDEGSGGASCSRCLSRELPCVGYRVTDVALYREQSAPCHLFSKRWKSMDMIDITDWADNDVRTIKISLAFLDAPFEVDVRKFVPAPGDSLEEKWVDKKGNLKKWPVPPYGIVCMARAAESISYMMDRNVVNYMNSLIGGGTGDESHLLWQTYYAAFRHCSNAPTEGEKTLLCNTFRLWASCRLTSHPDRIVGDEHLGMRQIDDPESPFEHMTPCPPVLGAQLECIMYSCFLRPLSDKVLRNLMELMEARQPSTWYTIYLALFVLLHSCAMMTRRDMEYAKLVSLKGMFANPQGIRKQMCGVITLLAHFHFAIKGAVPFRLALSGRSAELATHGALLPDQVRLIVNSARLVEKIRPTWRELRSSESYGHDFYWISQMYDENWKGDKMA
ncbi:hypothetical protein B0T25DRAFT_298854 [Lasiosphaeria hispida]|uniref:Zn(2)-C6 fungal-type domain-containing protein n=1 Tax=Lasiosphaeria hispida TaxID=260671 RepID=A0AAJ0H7T9_9PEZI|nr:hypothetical protein B0T25DRAFT_298854 [Lasiosphaeria hispida]